MINEQRLLEEFLELVQTDSETGHERKICDLLTSKLTELGFDVVEDHAASVTGHEAGNLIATLPGNITSEPAFFFTAHMDTVTPGIGVKPIIQDGYVTSDGTTILGSDDKAGLAAILEGIRVIQEQGILHSTIQLILTIGEESGLKGSRHLDSSLIHAEYGFALDSNGPVGEIITAAPAQVKMRASIFGKSAHAGVNPEDGVSAIQIASRAISKMSLGRIDHETTANIGRFQGGQATNIVPDFVEVLAEARSRNELKLKAQVAKMKQAFQTAAQELGGEVSVEVENLYPGFHFRTTDLVVQKAIAAVERIGRQPQIGASGGGSDANILSGMGIPTVNLGIGYENIHTTNERMPIAELNKAAELVVALVEECSKELALTTTSAESSIS